MSNKWPTSTRKGAQLKFVNIRERKIKTIMRYHLPLIKTATVKKRQGKSVGKVVYSAGGCALVQPRWKRVSGVLPKLKIELSYDPTLPLTEHKPKVPDELQD